MEEHFLARPSTSKVGTELKSWNWKSKVLTTAEEENIARIANAV